jgi:uncharacterized membrane protein (DUF106 family)
MALVEWFLSLPSIISIMAVCLLISIFSLLTMKFMTDQKLLKRLREEQADLRKKMKTAKDDQKKLMDLQKQAMEGSMEMMKQTMKPMFITMIPFILIFAWLNTHIGYYPLTEDTQFNITARFTEGTTGSISLVNVPKDITVLNGENQTIAGNAAAWILAGKAGSYTLTYRYKEATFQHQIEITNGKRVYRKPTLFEKDLGLKKSGLASIVIGNRPVRPFADVPILASIPWLKDRGWFFTYFVFALAFNITLRKFFKVY